MNTKRLIEFDIAKAVCIVLVVMGHFNIGHPEWWRITHDVIYTFHMPLFMFSSGYIYIAFKKDEGYGTFIWKKVQRLMIPYVMVSVIIITLKLLSERSLYVQNPVTLLSYFRILWYPEAGYFLWYIGALWWMFCIIPFFKTVKSRTILLILAFVLHYISPSLDLPEAFCFNQTAGYLLWFTLGVSCFDYKEKLLGLYKIPLLVIAVVFAGAEAVKFAFWADFGYILPYLGIAFIMRLSTALAKGQNINTYMYVSSCSYIIYLFHTTFMGFARAILLKIPVMNSGTDLIYTLTIIIVVTTGVVCPILLYQVLMRFKITRRLFGLKSY